MSILACVLTERDTALGSSLHETLIRLKAQPDSFPNIDISYAPANPLGAPVILNLPANGLRLRFDGFEQTLRLIEVLDFGQIQLNYNNTEFVKLPESRGATTAGPTFRHIYHMMGPTFPGEYLPPASSSSKGLGSYILSYPGVAFSFPLQSSAWKPELDHVSLLSSSAALPAKSLAVYVGSSWQDVREGLLKPNPPSPRLAPSPHRSKDHRPDEIELVRIQGNGKLEMMRRSSPPMQMLLGGTTPQDLVMELGPPDAIYYKNDRRLSIHKTRRPSHQQSQPYGASPTSEDDMTDTDQSSTHSNANNSDDESDAAKVIRDNFHSSSECFYNYFHHGFDIFMSYPTDPSPPFPTSAPGDQERPRTSGRDHLVATKVILHGNVPGSYPFNRYRRVRWVIETGDPMDKNVILDSESPFVALSQHLQQIWKGAYGSDSEEISFQRGMVLNRGWGDSPGDSCELLGGWEESADTAKKEGSIGIGGPGSGNTKLFGFPGLVFEVLKNDAVSSLTVY